MSGRPYSVLQPSVRRLALAYIEARFGRDGSGVVVDGTRLSPVNVVVWTGAGSVGGNVPGRNAKRMRDF